jgi:hypothetical protein
MKILKGLVLAGAASAIPLMFAANAASATGTTVSAATHLLNRPDTCACTTNVSSDNGNVWAYDNLSRQFTVTDNGGGSYKVVITDNGRFKAFAEPNNPDPSHFYPIQANGSVSGTNTYFVQSNQPPVASAVPSQIPNKVSTSDMIIQDLFKGGNASITGYGNYTYTYQSGTQTYTQTSTSPFITGNITGN